MQILEIVLYSRSGKKRTVKFRPGEVNIITGQSHTGKTSLLPIISYCLGGGAFQVPEGRILETVAWFGLLLQIGRECIFVARENPHPDRSSTSTAYLLRSVSESPPAAPAQPNVNIDALEDALSSLLGIAPNLNVPPPTSTRPALAANIRHSLIYCFQHQTEIATNQFLFHRQSADFLTSAIKDTLPYFLGAIREEELALEEQFSMAKRNLKLLEIRQNENQQIEGTGVSKATGLLREAVAVGLLANQPFPETMSELRELMLQTITWTPEQGTFAGADEISQLQQEVDVLKEQRGKLAETIRAAKAMSGEAQGFVDEARIQAERLESIGLFDDSADHSACPICAQHLSAPVPGAAMIQTALSELQHSLAATERERPRLREYIQERNTEMEAMTQLQAEKENAIIALQNEQAAAQQIRDLNSRRAKVIGRLSLYVESVQPVATDDRLSRDLAAAKREVERLGSMLDPAQKEQRLTSILNRLGLKMSEWARRLQLEFADSPVRLDVSAATLFVDTPARPVPLLHIGSGENWIAYHLIAHLALHRHFRQNDRPVPSFLFLDQPSQVYFPADEDPEETGDTSVLAESDRQKVARLFRLIFDAVAELAPNLQVIITDHADLRDDPDFQRAVIEKWRGPGRALIPDDW
ncbi:MAG TPA: DUF3732 domain-containing protein [Chthoniobacteraceae bacterium]|jgi:hypothetical protein|nr:DUF3732 domain-containing protein [Chthoniobacteraceae bacterium]